MKNIHYEIEEQNKNRCTMNDNLCMATEQFLLNDNAKYLIEVTDDPNNNNPERILEEKY